LPGARVVACAGPQRVQANGVKSGLRFSKNAVNASRASSPPSIARN
jgi:hypothetical protein